VRESDVKKSRVSISAEQGDERMEEPLVSVLMVTYNHARYIRKSIDGVLAQRTNFPYELVIGEDCSTDGTRQIVFDYQRRYPDTIRVITSERNVGGKKNVIRTRRACRGKYIAFCEGDDYWHHPEKLQMQADFLENHPECGLVYSNYNVEDVRSKTLIRDFISYKEWVVQDKLTPMYFLDGKMSVTILTCTVMVRNELLKKVIEADPYLYESGHFLMGDIQTWVEVSAIAETGYIPESLATYNVSEESATRSNNVLSELRFQASLSELTLYLSNKYNMSGDVRERRLEQWCDASLRLALHERNAALAKEIRKRKRIFTWKDRYRYFGALNALGYYSYILSLSLKKRLTRRRKKWYE